MGRACLGSGARPRAPPSPPRYVTHLWVQRTASADESPTFTHLSGAHTSQFLSAGRAAERRSPTHLCAEPALSCAETEGKHWPTTKKICHFSLAFTLETDVSTCQGPAAGVQAGARHQWFGLHALGDTG